MQTDWSSEIFQPHLKILKKYALEGKKLTQLYSSTLIHKHGLNCRLYRGHYVINEFMELMLSLLCSLHVHDTDDVYLYAHGAQNNGCHNAPQCIKALSLSSPTIIREYQCG